MAGANAAKPAEAAGGEEEEENDEPPKVEVKTVVEDDAIHSVR